MYLFILSVHSILNLLIITREQSCGTHLFMYSFSQATWNPSHHMQSFSRYKPATHIFIPYIFQFRFLPFSFPPRVQWTSRNIKQNFCEYKTSQYEFYLKIFAYLSIKHSTTLSISLRGPPFHIFLRPFFHIYSFLEFLYASLLSVPRSAQAAPLSPAQVFSKARLQDLENHSLQPQMGTTTGSTHFNGTALPGPNSS